METTNELTNIAFEPYYSFSNLDNINKAESLTLLNEIKKIICEENNYNFQIYTLQKQCQEIQQHLSNKKENKSLETISCFIIGICILCGLVFREYYSRANIVTAIFFFIAIIIAPSIFIIITNSKKETKEKYQKEYESIQYKINQLISLKNLLDSSDKKKWALSIVGIKNYNLNTINNLYQLIEFEKATNLKTALLQSEESSKF